MELFNHIKPDIKRIKRMALAGVQSNAYNEKHIYLWEILMEFGITTENITNAEPPNYKHQK